MSSGIADIDRPIANGGRWRLSWVLQMSNDIIGRNEYAARQTAEELASCCDNPAMLQLWLHRATKMTVCEIQQKRKLGELTLAESEEAERLLCAVMDEDFISDLCAYVLRPTEHRRTLAAALVYA